MSAWAPSPTSQRIVAAAEAWQRKHGFSIFDLVSPGDPYMREVFVRSFWIGNTSAVWLFEQMVEINTQDRSDTDALAFAFLIHEAITDAAKSQKFEAIIHEPDGTTTIAHVPKIGSVKEQIVAFVERVTDANAGDAWCRLSFYAREQICAEGKALGLELFRGRELDVSSARIAAARAAQSPRVAAKPSKRAEDAAVRVIHQAFRHLAGPARRSKWLTVQKPKRAGERAQAAGDGFRLVRSIGERYGVELVSPTNFKRMTGLDRRE